MSVTKLSLILLTIGMIALSAAQAKAEPGWYSCTITMAGPGWDQIFIRLSHAASSPRFTDKWYKPAPGLEKKMLATALAAMTNNMRVTAYLDPEAEYSYIYALYLGP